MSSFLLCVDPWNELKNTWYINGGDEEKNKSLYTQSAWKLHGESMTMDR